MNKVLLSVHVLAAIIFVGPVTVAASMFPPIARRSLTAGTENAGTVVAGTGDVGVLRVLHRISRGYAIGGLTVPVFGLAVIWEPRPDASLVEAEYWVTTG